MLTTRSSSSDQGLLFLWNSDHSTPGGNFLSICTFTMWSQGGMKGQNPVDSQKIWHSWALQACLSWVKLPFAGYLWKASGLRETMLWLWFSLHYKEHTYFRKFHSHFMLALKHYVVVKAGYNTDKQCSEKMIQIHEWGVERPMVWPSLIPGQLVLLQPQLRHRVGAEPLPTSIYDGATQFWGEGCLPVWSWGMPQLQAMGQKES